MTLNSNENFQKQDSHIVHRYLSNGMEVYLHSTNFAPIVSLQVLVKVGSIDETEQEGGLSHVLEHMLFKGTKKFSGLGEVATTVEAAGGDINAYTTFDHTNYYLSAPSSFVYKGTELLIDVVENSLLDEAELKKELEVVLEEIRRSKDSPSAVLSHSLFEKIYETTRLSRPVIGFQDVVKNFDRELLHDFYKRWYAPNNMIFIAAGDFEIEKMIEHLESVTKNFLPKSVPERFRPALQSFPKISPQENHKFLHEPVVILKRGPWQEIRLQIATYSTTLDDYDMPVWDVLSAILGESDSSRLVRLLREELQLVTSIDASCYTPKYPQGLFSVGFFCMTENAQEALKVTLQEIRRLGLVPPSKEELQRVCNAIKAQRIYSRESMDGISRSAGLSLMTLMKLDFENKYVERVLQVTAFEIQNLAKKIWADFEKGLWSISIAMSAEKEKGWTEESWKNLVHDTIFSSAPSEYKSNNKVTEKEGNNASFSLAAEIISKTSEFKSDVKQILIPLPHGKKLHINYRPSNRLPVVSGVLVFQGGILLEKPEHNGVAGLTMSMMTRGTKRQSYRKFIEELEDNASSISSFSGRDVMGLRFDSLKENALRTIEMMCDSLFQPEFSTDEWNRLHKETLEVLIAQKDSPTAKLSQILQPLLFPDHPYSLTSIGTTDSILKIHRENALKFWSQIFHAQDYVLSLTGDFKIEEIVNFVKDEFTQFFQNFSFSENIPSFQKAKFPTTSQNRYSFDILDREQTHIMLSFRSCDLFDEDRTALELAASILAGQGGRLFLDLRDQKSLAYSVSASQSPHLYGGSFSTYIACASHKTSEAIQGLKFHLEQLAKETPSQQEVDRAKQSLIGSQSIESQHHSYQASQLAMSDAYGLPFDNFLNFANRVNAVTPEKITTVLKSLLDKNPPILTAVGSKDLSLDSHFKLEEIMRWNL